MSRTSVVLVENSAIKSLRSQATSAKFALDGFPWLLATVLYTLSWGGSLLRPNTLYWDDWAFIYGQPKSYLNQIFIDTGLPPWRAIIDQELIAIGYWTLPVLTFFMFFGSGICLHLILQKVSAISKNQNKFITLLFLILPINHSRIALVLFGYTSSYFLFFLAWLLLVHSKKISTFSIALIIFFLSFMTHSFLFFYALPVMHFIAIQYFGRKRDPRKLRFFLQVICLLLLPFVYYFLRSLLWYPKPEWDGYHRMTSGGAIKGLIFAFIGSFIIGIVVIVDKWFDSSSKSLLIVFVGWLIFAWSLFPYFANGRLPDFISVFAFRSDWGGRHIMLTPLGASLIISGLSEIISRHFKTTFLYLALTISLVFNLFFATQFFLDSVKKEELTELFIEAGSSERINSKSKLYFVDETKFFNGRFSTYRDPELSAKLLIAKVKVESITGKASCQDIPNAVEVKVKTSRSYLSALLSRDLGLYFEIREC